MVVWDRKDYLMKAEKQLSDKNAYKEVNFNEELIQDLTETSNKIFRGIIDLKYFRFYHKRACNLGKLYLLPKVHKRLFNVPGQPVISNCGTPTEKASEPLYSHLKTIMQLYCSYKKDVGDFINKMSQFGDISKKLILVTADIVGFSPSISHKAGLKALKNPLGKNEQKHISIETLINMVEFVLKSNFFEFNGSVKQQVSGMAIGTKCAPTYACIFMDKVETEFLKTQERTPLIWFRYIGDIFFSILNLRTDINIYQHFTSSHPNNIKRSILCSKWLRVKRICSEKEDVLLITILNFA